MPFRGGHPVFLSWHVSGRSCRLPQVTVLAVERCWEWMIAVRFLAVGTTQKFRVRQTKIPCDSDGVEPLAFSSEIQYDLHRYYILRMNFTLKVQ